jgi:ligand-binding sensor domain-containing protein
MLLTTRWVLAGSLSDGLLVYNRATAHWTAITEGLPSRNVTALAESGGELYVGTENGIVKVAEARLP